MRRNKIFNLDLIQNNCLHFDMLRDRLTQIDRHSRNLNHPKNISYRKSNKKHRQRIMRPRKYTLFHSSLFCPLAHNKENLTFKYPANSWSSDTWLCVNLFLNFHSHKSVTVVEPWSHHREHKEGSWKRCWICEVAELLMQLRPQLQQVTAAELLSRPAWTAAAASATAASASTAGASAAADCDCCWNLAAASETPSMQSGRLWYFCFLSQ